MDQKPPLSGAQVSAASLAKKSGKAANNKADAGAAGAAGSTDPNFKVKKRRHRRTAAEIERTHACTYPGCTKAYGSESSLNQHIRLKHSKVSSAAPKQFGGFPMGMFMGMYGGQLPGGAPPCGISGQPLFPTAAGAPRPNKKLKSPDCSPLLLPKPPPNMQIPDMNLNGMDGAPPTAQQQQQFMFHQQFMASLQQQFMQQSLNGNNPKKDFVTPLVGPMEATEPGSGGSTEARTISPPAFSLGENSLAGSMSEFSLGDDEHVFSLGESALKTSPVGRAPGKHLGSMKHSSSSAGLSTSEFVSAGLGLDDVVPQSSTGLTILTGGASPRKQSGKTKRQNGRSLSAFSPLTSPVTTPTFDALVSGFGPLTPQDGNGHGNGNGIHGVKIKSEHSRLRPTSSVGSPRKASSGSLDEHDLNVSSIDLLEWTKSLFPADEIGDDAFGKAMQAALNETGKDDHDSKDDGDDLDINALHFALRD